MVGTKRNSKAFGAMSKSNRRLRYLASLLHKCQIVKDGIIPRPKARTIERGVMTQSSTCILRTNTGKGKKWGKMLGRIIWKNE
jgi:hypothetical protein